MRYLKFALLSLIVVFQSHGDNSESINSIIKNNKNVLVHVHASWCPSCKQQSKILAQVNQSNFKLLEVDFDKDKKFLKENKIFQQSMLVAFQNAKEKKRVFGITKKEKIMEFVSSSFNRSLQSVIDEKKSKSKVPQKDRMTMEQATQKLRESGIIDNVKKEGDQYIDFTLPNIEGKKIKLSDKLKDGPVILTFYRGGWCPYCNIQLREYQKRLSEFKGAGAQLIAVSPETIDSANDTVDKNKIEFEILTDNLNKEARKYGLVFKLEEELKNVYLKFGLDLAKNQGNDTWELPIPATYVISKEGKIVYSFINVDYVQRAEPNDILNVLKSLRSSK